MVKGIIRTGGEVEWLRDGEICLVVVKRETEMQVEVKGTDSAEEVIQMLEKAMEIATRNLRKKRMEENNGKGND